MVIYRYTLPTFFLFVSYGICRGKEREKKYRTSVRKKRKKRRLGGTEGQKGPKKVTRWKKNKMIGSSEEEKEARKNHDFFAAALTFLVVELVFLPVDSFAVAIFFRGAVGTFLTVFLAAVGFGSAFLTAAFGLVVFLTAEGLLAGLADLEAGLGALGSETALASLTLPLAPLGSAKMPFSAPRWMALFRRVMLAGVSRTLNRKARYFLIAGRLTPPRTFSLSFLMASLIMSSIVSLRSVEEALGADGEVFLGAVAFLVAEEVGFLAAETGFLAVAEAGLALEDGAFDLEAGLALEAGLLAACAGEPASPMT